MFLIDFNNKSPSNAWTVVNDGVMGGLSAGNFYVNDIGNGIFEGEVSRENNGGFSLVRHRFDPIPVTNFSKCLIRLKGDGKRYQFRLKSKAADKHSWVSYFETTADWQTIGVSFDELFATYKGKRLDMSHFPAHAIGEVAFLIGNKKAEKFRLEVEKIWLE